MKELQYIKRLKLTGWAFSCLAIAVTLLFSLIRLPEREAFALIALIFAVCMIWPRIDRANGLRRFLSVTEYFQNRVRVSGWSYSRLTITVVLTISLPLLLGGKLLDTLLSAFIGFVIYGVTAWPYFDTAKELQILLLIAEHLQKGTLTVRDYPPKDEAEHQQLRLHWQYIAKLAQARIADLEKEFSLMDRPKTNEMLLYVRDALTQASLELQELEKPLTRGSAKQTGIAPPPVASNRTAANERPSARYYNVGENQNAALPRKEQRPVKQLRFIRGLRRNSTLFTIGACISISPVLLAWLWLTLEDFQRGRSLGESITGNLIGLFVGGFIIPPGIPIPFCFLFIKFLIEARKRSKRAGDIESLLPIAEQIQRQEISVRKKPPKNEAERKKLRLKWRDILDIAKARASELETEYGKERQGGNSAKGISEALLYVRDALTQASLELEELETPFAKGNVAQEPAPSPLEKKRRPKQDPFAEFREWKAQKRVEPRRKAVTDDTSIRQ